MRVLRTQLPKIVKHGDPLTENMPDQGAPSPRRLNRAMPELEHAEATQRRYVWLTSASSAAWRALLGQNDYAADLMVSTPRMSEVLRHIGWEATPGTTWAYIARCVLPISGPVRIRTGACA